MDKNIATHIDLILKNLIKLDNPYDFHWDWTDISIALEKDGINLNEGEIKQAINKLKEPFFKKSQVVTFWEGNIDDVFELNDLTEPFIKYGGAKQIAQTLKISEENEAINKYQKDRIQELELSKLEWYDKTKWLPLSLSILSIAIAILGYFKD